MTRYLSLAEVLDLYARVVALGGGAFAIRDLGALEVFLVLNGFELRVSVDAAESMILGVAEGTVARATFVDWIAAHVTAYPSQP